MTLQNLISETKFFSGKQKKFLLLSTKISQKIRQKHVEQAVRYSARAVQMFKVPIYFQSKLFPKKEN